MADRLPSLLIVAASALALALALALDAPSAVRVPLALWFLAACPGIGLVPLLGRAGLLERLVLILALSVALDVLVATTMLYLGLWSAPAIFAVLAAVALVGGALQLRAAPQGAG